MATVHCFTDRLIPHRCSSTAMENTASLMSRRALPSISGERKLMSMRKTPTSSYVIRPIIPMRRICSSHECTIPDMLPHTIIGWKEHPVGCRKAAIFPTTVAVRWSPYICPHSCRTSSSSSPISVTSCTGVTLCGTSLDGRTTSKDMVSWSMATGSQVFPSSMTCV